MEIKLEKWQKEWLNKSGNNMSIRCHRREGKAWHFLVLAAKAVVFDKKVVIIISMKEGRRRLEYKEAKEILKKANIL